ncbi:MAG: hypothetical protein WED34_16870, partial [Planctomycetales bacterium]
CRRKAAKSAKDRKEEENFWRYQHELKCNDSIDVHKSSRCDVIPFVPFVSFVVEIRAMTRPFREDFQGISR